MAEINPGDIVFTFMGESLLQVKVLSLNCSYDGKKEVQRLVAEDECNTYTFYSQDCYLTKEEAITGMLDSIGELTECDCGEDAETIQHIKDCQNSDLKWLLSLQGKED